MNILTDAPPEILIIPPTEYRIDTDFRNCLKIMLAFEDNDLTSQEKQAVMLNNLYSVVPGDLDAAVEQAQWFLNCGKVSTDENATGARVYSFEKDASLIFAAFWQTHGVDLTTTKLHWWTFLALFMDLGQDTTFCQLVSLRKRLQTGKATKEERQAAREMGELIDLDEIDTRTLDEKQAESDFLAKVKSLEAKREAKHNV